MAGFPISARVISMIFHWFYNGIRLRQPTSQNWAISIVLLMLFQRNDMPAELHPGFAISLIILRIFNEISLIPVSAKHFRLFCDFVDKPNAFSSKFRWFRRQTGPSRNEFFGGGNPAAWLCRFRWFTNGFPSESSNFAASIGRLPEFANSLISHWFFNEINVFIVAAWVMPFRWSSIGFSSKSAHLHSFARIPHFVDLLTVFQLNSTHITHWRFCWFRWLTKGFSTEFDASCRIMDL